MIKQIAQQIDNINESLDWIKVNKSDHYEKKFLELVEERRKLRKLLNAEKDNPAIAAFGKSQVGKSYLMSCILQDNGRPFMVDTENGKYNFIEAINPIGDDKEATGVVTRFSSFKRNAEIYSKEYPVMMRPLTVKDLILIISDSYFNDFSDWTTDSENDIVDKSDGFYSFYNTKPSINEDVLTADDILDIKLYFSKHINNAQVYYDKTTFFDRLALFIDKVPYSDYIDIFSILWHNENDFTKLFQRCLDIIRRFHFAQYVYLPIEAVLHDGIKENTVMSVECLKHLYDVDANNFTTDVYIQQERQYINVGKISKSEICAVCAEVIFRIPEEFLSSTGAYCLDDIPDETRKKLNTDVVKMEILRQNDLLDFPGARSREKRLLSKLQGNYDTLLYCFLRGKVAYLFNKYNEDLAINILLYSHHNKDNDVTDLWQLLESWVNNYVGDTMEKRRATLERTANISPLFYIGTMFNLDIANSKNGTVGDSENAIRQRWTGRFRTVLLDQCLHPKDVDWVNNWIDTGIGFQNSYVLRDYKFSDMIYSGYKETGRETKMLISSEYYATMRRTFAESNKEFSLFKDPLLSWDLAASKGNDGALYIIEQLSIVASCMLDNREKQFLNILGDVKNAVMNIMSNYYVSEDADEILENNIRKANCIIRELDFTCNEDNYYFGHLIQALQLSETKTLKVVHNLLQSPGLINKATDFKDYELIRKRCINFEGCNTEEDKWERLIQRYSFRTKEEASVYLLKRNIDYKLLFSGEFKKKLNSCIIVNQVMELWINKIKSLDFVNSFTGESSFDSIVMGDLIDNLISTSNILKLEDKLADLIAEYVNVINIATANESLVADMLASSISEFVMNFGYDMLLAEDIEKAKSLSQKRSIPVFDYIERERKSTYVEEELTLLFDDMNTNPKAITLAFENSYYSWMEFMFLSFIVHLNVPDFDHEANEKLFLILKKIA